MIEVKNITYLYPGNEIPALEDVSVTIQDNQWIALVGHNGSGKSTIARIMDGLVDDYRGTVVINGIELTDDTVWDIRDQIGLCFKIQIINLLGQRYKMMSPLAWKIVACHDPK